MEGEKGESCVMHTLVDFQNIIEVETSTSFQTLLTSTSFQTKTETIVSSLNYDSWERLVWTSGETSGNERESWIITFYAR